MEIGQTSHQFVKVIILYNCLLTCQSFLHYIGIRCPKLEAPKGGKVIVSGYYVDDYAIYRCGYGYNLSGYTERRVCQVDGTWSGDEPTCTYDDKYYDDSYGHDAGYGHSQYGRSQYGRGGYDNKKDYQ